MPRGFRIEAVVEGLDAPTMVAFDDQGRMLIAESGYLGGGSSQVTRVEADGSKTVLAGGDAFGRGADRELAGPHATHQGGKTVSREPIVSRGSMRRLALVENVLVRLLPRQARRGSTWFGRLGDIAQQPPVWMAAAGLLAATGGARGRRAAARGSVSYGAAAVVANLIIKPVVGRKRPPGSGAGRPGPVTSSLPSGHAATDLAFSLAACQEMPLLFLPLTVATCASHWSLIRSRGHYPTDVLVGGAVGVAAAAVLWVLWPPGGATNHPQLG